MKLFSAIFLIKFIFNLTILGQGFGSSGAIDARSVALAGTGIVSAKGVYALGINPANLVLVDDHKIEFSTFLPLPAVNVSVGNDFITLNDYQYFFTGVKQENGEIHGRFLNDGEKSKFLRLFEDGSMMNTNLSINLLSFTIYLEKEIGGFGFAIQDWSSARTSMPKQLFELILYGNEPGKTYDLSDLDTKIWYLRNYSLTYSRDLSKYLSDVFNFFSAGFSVKLIHGLFYAGVDEIHTTFKTEENYNIDVNGNSRVLVAASPSLGLVYDFEDDVEREGRFGLFNNPAGKGIGFDLGFFAELNKSWFIAFALTDLGSISWSKGLAEYSSKISYTLEDITDENLVDSLRDALLGEGKVTSPFRSGLSTAMTMGVGFKLDKYLKNEFPGTLSLELNYHQGLNNMPSNSTYPRFSIGAEWLPMEWFKFRTGISLGGYDGFNWALGIGFDADLIEIDLATAYTHSIFNANNAKRLGFAISSRWIF